MHYKKNEQIIGTRFDETDIFFFVSSYAGNFNKPPNIPTASGMRGNFKSFAVLVVGAAVVVGSNVGRAVVVSCGSAFGL